MGPSLKSFEFPAMGGLGHFFLDSHSSDSEEVFKAVLEEIVRIEGRFSRFLPSNWMAEINRAAANGGTIDLDEETSVLIDFSFAAFKMSDGLFDITSGLLRRAWNFHDHSLPDPLVLSEQTARIGLDKVRWDKPTLSFLQAGMEIDFGGIGKEYAVDRAIDLCLSLGLQSALLELAGDIRVLGSHPTGIPWQIGLRDADASAAVALESAAIATSGTAERGVTIDGKRYCHILDPKTGWPVQGLSSVTVVAPTCLAAGTVSTIGMLMGPLGPSFLAASGFAHRWLNDEGESGGDLSASLSVKV